MISPSLQLLHGDFQYLSLRIDGGIDIDFPLTFIKLWENVVIFVFLLCLSQRTYGQWWKEAPSGVRELMPQNQGSIVSQDFIGKNFHAIANL